MQPAFVQILLTACSVSKLASKLSSKVPFVSADVAFNQRMDGKVNAASSADDIHPHVFEQHSRAHCSAIALCTICVVLLLGIQCHLLHALRHSL